MKAILNRFYQDDEVTLGILTIEGRKRPLFYTCENPWRDNQRQVSCIPTGVYQVRPFSGNTYKDVYRLEDVPGRDAILMHWGNTPRDTQGCILIGQGCGQVLGVDGVTESRVALNKFVSLLDYQPFELQIMGGEG